MEEKMWVWLKMHRMDGFRPLIPDLSILSIGIYWYVFVAVGTRTRRTPTTKEGHAMQQCLSLYHRAVARLRRDDCKDPTTLKAMLRSLVTKVIPGTDTGLGECPLSREYI